MLKLPETEKSYWKESHLKPSYPKLSEDIEVDVAIIGAGITGLTSAYLLKQAGLKVAVIEKRTVGAGTTGRTTGKVTSQHNLIYANLNKRFGENIARLYGEANQAGVDQVEAIVKREAINCGWKREDNYVFTADPEQVKTFKEEAIVAAELGLPASFETKSPLPFEIAGAVKFKNQGRFRSVEYLLGLARAVDGDGSYVFEQSNVIGIHEGKPCRIRTTKARVVSTDIIVATNVPTMPLMARGGYCILEYPTESYIVAGKLPKSIPGMYISPDEEHYSILPVDDIILIGGEGHFSGLRGNTKARYQRLADYAEKHFGVSQISHRWSDRDYLAYDDMPLIGRVYPWSKHMYTGTAYHKWGLSNGTVAGMILRDLIVGKDNPWAKVFTPQRRSPITSIPRKIPKILSGKG